MTPMVLPGITRLSVIFDTTRATGDWAAIHHAVHGSKATGSATQFDSSAVVSRQWQRDGFHVVFEVWSHEVKGRLHWHLNLHRNPKGDPPSLVLKTSQRVGWLEAFDGWLEKITDGGRIHSGRCTAQFEFATKSYRNLFDLPGRPSWRLPDLGGTPELFQAGVRAGKTLVTCEVHESGQAFLLTIKQPLAGGVRGIIQRAQAEARRSLQPFLREKNRHAPLR